ncbi:MAG: hypothetical protein HN783_04790, partial [Ilumatobacter sp.]|nr:hypothetical protein [Ilumatobacter sp.]
MSRPEDRVQRGDRQQRRGRPRRSAGPLLVLGAFAVIPAIALFALFSWADGSIEENEPAPPPPSTVVAPPAFADPLSTSMLSMRRVPAVLSRQLNV